MIKPSQAIGIFDSGIGGLTVAKAINKILPNESLIYFGDTEHMPYGDKSCEHILQYSKRIAEFLIFKKVKIIVIACNSASAVAYEYLKKHYKNKIDIIGVIEPVANHLAEKTYKKVGIIGTKATIGSGAYEKKLTHKSPNLKVASLATPLLAPMIEEGFFKNEISQNIINNYLENRTLNNIESLVLACTHYPLIKKQIKDFYENKIDIVDPSETVAIAVRKSLQEQNLIFDGDATQYNDRFFVSEYTKSFETSTRLFYGKAVNIEEVKMWA